MNQLKELLKIYEETDRLTNEVIKVLADQTVSIKECRVKVAELTKQIDYHFAKAYNLDIEKEEKSYLEYVHQKIQVMIRLAPHISDNGER